MSKIGRSALKKSGQRRNLTVKYTSNLIPSLSVYDEAIRNMIYDIIEEEQISQWTAVNIWNKGEHRDVRITFPKPIINPDNDLLWKNRMQDRLKESGIKTETTKNNLGRYVISFSINNKVVEGMIKLF